MSVRFFLSTVTSDFGPDDRDFLLKELTSARTEISTQEMLKTPCGTTGDILIFTFTTAMA